VTTAEEDLGELPRVAVGPAPLAPRRNYPISRNDGQLKSVLIPTGIAYEQVVALRRKASLDPPVAPSALLANHQ
jgi:hypothetical protein